MKEGGGPPAGEPSQPNSGGGYLPGGLLGGGGGGPGGSDGQGNAHPGQAILGVQNPLMNGGLKGTTPATFNGNQKHMKQFMQEFTLYKMINQESPTMRNAYTRVALALSIMRGAVINNWVLQQTE